MNDEPKALLDVIRDAGAMYYKRRDALQKLARIEAAMARSPLLAALTDPEKVLRREATKLLGAYPDAEVRKALAGALSDEDSDVRRNAARALKETGATEALEVLRLAAGNDGSIFVRREAEEAVKELEARAPSPTKVAPSKTGPPAPSPVRAPEPERPAPRPPEAKQEPPSAVRSGSLPPWKREDGHKEVKPSLEHFKAAAAARRAAPLESRPDGKPQPPAGAEAKPSGFGSAEDRLPPWKRTGSAGPGLAASMAQAMRPEKPKPPTKIRVGKIHEKIPVARIEKRSRKTPVAPLPVPTPVPGIEKITRKVRKAVASRAVGAQLCPKCQWVVKPGQRFCTFCGHPMIPASARVDSTARQVPARIEPPSPARAPRRPRPPAGSASPAPFFKAGCIVAAIVGFVFMLSIFVCVAGSGEREPEELPSSRSAMEDWQTEGAPAASERPGLDGPNVVVILTTGRTYRGKLLQQTPDHIRLKWREKILRIQRRVVRRIEYQ